MWKYALLASSVLNNDDSAVKMDSFMLMHLGVSLDMGESAVYLKSFKNVHILWTDFST